MASELQLITIVDDAEVREAPKPDAKELTHLKKGIFLKCDGIRKNGYFRLVTKSKKPMWIADTLVDVYSPSADIVQGGPVSPKRSAPAGPTGGAPKRDDDSPARADFKRWSVDLGASTGSTNTVSYFEINLGINYFIERWLIFRNAPFYRSQSGGDAAFGLDSSLDGVLEFELGEVAKVQLLAGAGYRILNQGTSAPFVESGVGLAIGPLVLDLGMKRIFNELVDKASSNEILYTIKATGGVSF